VSGFEIRPGGGGCGCGGCGGEKKAAPVHPLLGRAIEDFEELPVDPAEYTAQPRFGHELAPQSLRARPKSDLGSELQGTKPHQLAAHVGWWCAVHDLDRMPNDGDPYWDLLVLKSQQPCGGCW